MKTFKFLLSFTLCFSVLSVSAQLTVDNTMTVEELVNDVLLGEGVTASNITFNGDPGDQAVLQAGTFNSENSNIPITSGVILGSGDNVGAIGPNDDGASTVGGSGVDGDSDLQLAVHDPIIRDIAIIEFDFVANADSLKFNYVFGSEEYNEFVCGNVNDVFGFFISGPGINGPYSNNAANIALVPNTDIPVSINTVNIGEAGGSGTPDTCAALDPNWQANSVYYVDNDGNSDPNSTQYDGFTVILQALADIQCGATYHIKIAVADAGDPLYDSSVFLEAGSFSAFGEVFVNVSPTIGGAPVINSDYDSVLVAGCSEAYIQLIRPNGLNVDSVFVEFGGTANEGEDYYLGENDTLFNFSEGVDTLNFTINTLYDGVPGEGEFIEITIFYPNGCGELDSASTSIPIVDPYHFTTETEDVEVFCPADSVFIEAQGVDGIEPYQYNWGDVGIGQTVYAGVPPDEQYYDVYITDACGFDTIPDSVLVTNSIPPPLMTGIDPFDQPECTNQPVALYSTTQGGNGEYTYIWEDPLGNSYPSNEGIGIENINQVIQFNPEPINYVPSLPVVLTVIDTCGTTVTDSVEIDYPFFDPMTANFNDLTDNCPEDPVELSAKTQEGAGDVSYQWAITQGDGTFANGFGNATAKTYVVPSGGMNEFTVTARDKCNRANYDYQYIVNNSELASAGLAEYSDSLRVIKLDHIMNVMTPNGDGKNDYFIVEGIQEFDNAHVQIFDRWGKVIYETDNYQAGDPMIRPDNSFDAGDFDDGTYYYVIDIDNGECTQSGAVEVLRGNN